jgi:hypothetical protein
VADRSAMVSGTPLSSGEDIEDTLPNQIAGVQRQSTSDQRIDERWHDRRSGAP